MRVVLQRVSKASVTNFATTNALDASPGLLLFIGIHKDDTVAKIESMAKRVANLKVFNGDTPDKKWSLSLLDLVSTDLENYSRRTNTRSSNETDPSTTLSLPTFSFLPCRVLVVSNFTLYARTEKGKKPDFHESMTGEQARLLYEQFCQILSKLLFDAPVKKGMFREYMEVQMVQEGIVNMVLDN